MSASPPWGRLRTCHLGLPDKFRATNSRPWMSLRVGSGSSQAAGVAGGAERTSLRRHFPWSTRARGVHAQRDAVPDAEDASEATHAVDGVLPLVMPGHFA